MHRARNEYVMKPRECDEVSSFKISKIGIVSGASAANQEKKQKKNKQKGKGDQNWLSWIYKF